MRVLIVDDSGFARQFARKFITDRCPDIECLMAASGEEGYEMYLEFKPDFVISDLLMPGIGGEAMISMIREADRGSRIIVVSSDIQKAVKEEMAQMGVVAFINKPLNDENGQVLINILEGKTNAHPDAKRCAG